MQSVRLIQFSDLHLFGEASGRLRGVACLPALQAAVADAQRRSPRADGVLLTGDLVQDDPEGYRWVRHVFGASRVPVLCLGGQSRSSRSHARGLARRAVQGRRSHRVRPLAGGHAGFLVANDAGGRVGAEQLNYLREVLRTIVIITCWCACTITRSRSAASGWTRSVCTMPTSS